MSESKVNSMEEAIMHVLGVVHPGKVMFPEQIANECVRLFGRPPWYRPEGILPILRALAKQGKVEEVPQPPHFWVRIPNN